MAKRRYSNRRSTSFVSIIFGILILLTLYGYRVSYKLVMIIFLCFIIAISLNGFINNSVFHKSIGQRKRYQHYLESGIDKVDTMAGVEFELFLEAHFHKQNYSVSLTPKSNDYGADLILNRNRTRIVIQAKRWNQKVGVQSIQEVVGALNHYKADKAIVITNNYFTKQAKVLAESNSVELWDRDELIKMMKENGSKDVASNVLHKSIDDMLCPICKGSLVLRNGKNGQFYGCSNYPKCGFTRSKSF